MYRVLYIILFFVEMRRARICHIFVNFFCFRHDTPVQLYCILYDNCFCFRHRAERENVRPNGLLVDINYKDQYSSGTLLDKEKAYASTLTMRQAKPRSFSGEYASIWETQYPGSPTSLPPEGAPQYPPVDGGYGGVTEPTLIVGGGYGVDGNVPVVGYRSHPRVEHIYESPKFERSDTSQIHVCSDLPVYYELDPDEDAARQHGGHTPNQGPQEFTIKEPRSHESSLQRPN